jgi:hypothetical protein
LNVVKDKPNNHTLVSATPPGSVVMIAW